MAGKVCLGSGRKRWWVRRSSSVNIQPRTSSRSSNASVDEAKHLGSIDAVDEAKHLVHIPQALATPSRCPRDDSSDGSRRRPDDSCAESGSGSGTEGGSRCSSKESTHSCSVMSTQKGESGPVSAYNPAEHRSTPSNNAQKSDHGTGRVNNSETKRSVSPYCVARKDEGVVSL